MTAAARKRRKDRTRQWQRRSAERTTVPQCRQQMKGKAAQRERQRWKRKLEQKFPSAKKHWIATWKFQRCKNQVDGRGRIQHVLRAIQKHRWNIMLRSEISSKDSGFWWYEDSSVLIHGKRATVVLRNQCPMAE